MRNKLIKYKAVLSFLSMAVLAVNCLPQGQPNEPPIIKNVPLVPIEEEFRVSEFNNGDFFGFIHSVFIGADSTIFAADLSNRRIQLFDYDGRFKHHLGGEGEGPGEFRRISNVNLIAPDTLLVIDISSARLSFFAQRNKDFVITRTAAYPQIHKMGDDSEVYGFRNLFRIHDGYVGVFESTISAFKPGTDNFIRLCFVLLNDGLQINPVYEQKCFNKQELLVHQSGGTSRQTVSTMPVPGGYQTLYAFSKTGELITTWTGEKSVKIHAFLQSELREFEYTVYVNPIASKRREEMAADNELTFSRSELLKKIPSRMPFAEQMLADDENQIWLLVRTDEHNLEWHVYDFDGRLRKKIVHPGETVTQIKGNRMYAYDNEGEDGPAIVVYKMIMQPVGDDAQP